MLCRDFVEPVEPVRGRLFTLDLPLSESSTPADVALLSLVDADRIRRLRIGFNGRMKAQQIAQQRTIAVSTSRPYFVPNLSKRNRDNGANVIEPMPVPAVTIPTRASR